MKSKTKKIITWIILVIASIIITMSAIMKLAGMPQLTGIFSKIGLLPYIKILGAAELGFTALFLYARTMKIGFLLINAYFGGAMAVELSHGNIFVFPPMILAIVWVAAFLRDDSIFKSFQKQRQVLSA
jgi:hypothetical protein